MCIDTHTHIHIQTHTRARARAYTRGERLSAYTRVPRNGPQVCEVFWALSRNAEWVMHPAQARGRQMNYNISFSRPYIPTDRAYWRGLIAFNSLLVHPYNGPRTKGDIFSSLRSLFCLFLFLPSIAAELPFCPLSAFPPFPLSIHRLVVEIIIALFCVSFSFATTRSSDVNAATETTDEKFWVVNRGRWLATHVGHIATETNDRW